MSPARNVQNFWIASCPKPPNSLSTPLLEDGWHTEPPGGNNAVCLRVGNCEEKNGQGSLPRRKPCCSQIKPEMSRISGLLPVPNHQIRYQSLYYKMHPDKNNQGGGTRNPQEANNAVCLIVKKHGLPRRITNTKPILNCSESTEKNTELILNQF